MISGKKLFIEISNQPVHEDGESVGYFIKNSRMNDLDTLLNATAQPVSEGWVKCSERMPEEDGHYLVFANESTLDGYCDHNDIACYQQGKWSNEFNWLVTHWMPLPAAPGGQDD